MQTIDSVLAQTLQATLQGADPEPLYQASAAAREELRAQRAQIAERMAQEDPEIRIRLSMEGRSLERSFQDYFQLLELCDRHREDSSWLQAAVDNVNLVQKRLHVDMARLREGLYAERGPYTHPGLNRLLGAVHGGRVEEYLQALPDELDRQDLSLASRDWLASLLREETEWNRKYLQLLEAAPSETLPDEEWWNQACQLGESYARCDREAFRRRYGDGPTALPILNLALNGLWAAREGYFAQSATFWFVSQAAQQLQQVEDQFIANRPAEATEPYERTLETLSHLLDLLDEPLSVELQALLDASKAYQEALTKLS